MLTMTGLGETSVGPAVLPGPAKAAEPQRAKSSRRERIFRRLDLEVEKADCDRLDDLKTTLGVRSIADVIRQALRVHFYLVSQIKNGYEIQLVHEETKKQITVKLL